MLSCLKGLGLSNKYHNILETATMAEVVEKGCEIT